MARRFRADSAQAFLTRWYQMAGTGPNPGSASACGLNFRPFALQFHDLAVVGEEGRAQRHEERPDEDQPARPVEDLDHSVVSASRGVQTVRPTTLNARPNNVPLDVLEAGGGKLEGDLGGDIAASRL